MKLKSFYIAIYGVLLSSICYADTPITRQLRVGSPVNGSTSGSVLYIDSSGQLAQDNSNFFWDATNHRLGIGVSTIPAKMTVAGNNIGTTSEATYPGVIQINDNGGLTSNVGGLEFKTATAGSGYGWRITAPDLGTGETPLYFQNRVNSASWSNKITILNSGNVGIGTATPGSVFHILKSSGDAIIKIQTDGNGSTPAFLMADKTSGGVAQEWYTGTNISDGNAAWEVYNNTSSGSRLYISRSTSWGVGIGTTSPGAKLEVDGAASSITSIFKANATTPGDLMQCQTSSGTVGILASSSNFNPGDWGITVKNCAVPTLRLQTNVSSGNGSGPALLFTDDNGTDIWQFFMPSLAKGFGAFNRVPFAYGYYINASNQMIIGSAYVDLAPSITGQLDVVSQSATRIALIAKGASSQSANLQEWQNNSSVALTNVDSLGDLNFIHTNGHITWASSAMSIYHDGSNGSVQNTVGGFNFTNTAATGAMAFSTNNTTRLFIDSSGNVGIGTTSPGSLSGAKFDVSGRIASIGSAGEICITRRDTSAAAWSIYSGSGSLQIYDQATPGDKFTMTTGGAATFAGDVSVPDEAYGSGWNGSLEVPTKNAIYDKLETVASDVLFDHFADVGNVGTGEDDLYSDTTATSQLSANGQKITAQYAGTFVSSATATRRLRAYFGGTLIYDSTALSLSTSADWDMTVLVQRESATVVRCSVKVNTTTASSAPYTAYTRITGLTLSNTNILKVTGEAAGVGAADNDIVAKLGYVEFKPFA